MGGGTKPLERKSASPAVGTLLERIGLKEPMLGEKSDQHRLFYGGAPLKRELLERSDGSFLGKWGSEGSSDGQFSYPQGVTVAPDGMVYVADRDNDRIQAFGIDYPTTWRGEYFANRWLVEAPVLIRNEAEINFYWGTGSPAPSVPSDNFSALWQRYVWFEADTYRFTISTDGGVRLWVGDRLLIEQWQDQSAAYNADISLTQGYHRVRLEYYDSGGSSAVRLSWTASE